MIVRVLSGLIFSFLQLSCVNKSAVELVFSSKNKPSLQVNTLSKMNFTAALSNEIELSVNLASVSQMSLYISTSKACINQWESFKKITTVNLQSISEQQFVNVKVKTDAGFESDCMSLPLTLDQTPPVIAPLKLESNRALPNRSPRIVKPEISESGSGVAKVEMRMVYQDGTIVKDWTERPVDDLILTLSSSEVRSEFTDPSETYTLQVRATDKVGNMTNVTVATNPFLVGPVAVAPSLITTSNHLPSVRASLTLSKPAEANSYVKTLAVSDSAIEGIDFLYPTIIPVDIYAQAGSTKLEIEINLNPAMYPWTVSAKKFKLKLLSAQNFAVETDTIEIELKEPTPVTPGSPLEGFTDISSFQEAVCALHESKTIYCWGRLFSSLGWAGFHRPKQLPGATDVKKLFPSSGAALCFAKMDDTLWCFGENGTNVLGVSGTLLPASLEPVRVGKDTPVDRVLKADSNGVNTCALNFSNELFCWGADGGLGIRSVANTVNDTDPAKIQNLTKVIDFSLSERMICVIDEIAVGNRVVKCWGSSNPILVADESTMKQVSGIIGQPQTISIARADFWQTLGGCVTTEAQRVFCWGGNYYYKRGQEKHYFEYTDMQFMEANEAAGTITTQANVLLGGGIKQLEVGRASVCFVSNLNEAWCWGEVEHQKSVGSSGGNSRSIRSSAAKLSQSEKILKVTNRAKAVTCYLLEKGRISCVGSNVYGEAGPVLPFNVERAFYPLGATEIQDMSVLEEATCVLTKANEVKCWGNNSMGLLGYHKTGYFFPSYTKPPDNPVLTDVKSLQGRESSICALKFNGEFYCWGNDGYMAIGNAANYAVDGGFETSAHIDVRANTVGAPLLINPNKRTLGDGSTSEVLPAGEKVEKFFTNGMATCVVVSGGKGIRCWGSNMSANIGFSSIGKKSARLLDLPIPTNEEVLDIKLGIYNTCIVTKTSGIAKTKIFCNGNLSSGIPVSGQSGTSYNFKQVIELDYSETLQIQSLSLSVNMGCFIYDNELYCWGKNTANFLRLPQVSTIGAQALTPAVVPGTIGVESVDISARNGCIVYKEGFLKDNAKYGIQCWGFVYYLGDYNQFSYLDSPTSVLAGAYKSFRHIRVASAFANQQLWGVAPLDIERVSPRHYCAADSKNYLVCWGTSGTGEGNTEGDIMTPAPVVY